MSATTTHYQYRGELAGDIGIDKDGKMTATRNFKFWIQEYKASELPSLIRDSNLPKRYSTHPGDSALKCTDIKAAQMSGGDEVSGAVIVTCTYKNYFDGGGGSTQAVNTDPWDQPVQGYSYEPMDEVKPVLKAWRNDLSQPYRTVEVKNTAGDIMLMNDWNGVMCMRFYYFVKDFDNSHMENYHNSINKYPITICGMMISGLRGRFRKIAPKPVYLYNSSGTVSKTYYQVDVEVLHSPDKDWKIEALNAGTRLNIGGKLYEIYTDGKGNYGAVGTGDGFTFTDSQLTAGDLTLISTEVPISEDGTSVIPPGKKLHYKEFEYREMDWSKISLPKDLRT